MKFQIDLLEEHFALLEQMAPMHYRDPKQQAAWLIGQAVEAWQATREACEPAAARPPAVGEAVSG